LMGWKNEAGSNRHQPSSIWMTLKPLFVLTLCPVMVYFFWMAGKQQNGSLTALLSLFSSKGVLETMLAAFPNLSDIASQWKVFASFVALEALCVLFLPGGKFHGPCTPSGIRVFYTHNGTLCFFVSLAAYFAACFTGIYEYGSMYHRLGALLVFLNVTSVILCTFLYWKGVLWPSGPDVDRSGNIVVDFYWGTELHPRIGQFDIKSFVITRIGMIGWALLIIDFAGEQYRMTGTVSDSMLVSIVLQIIYLVKFFFMGNWLLL